MFNNKTLQLSIKAITVEIVFLVMFLYLLQWVSVSPGGDGKYHNGVRVF
jgi:hypothetical protein